MSTSVLVAHCDDEQLVALVRVGDGAAFEAMVHRHGPCLMGYARRFLGGRHHDAEEVVQDVFLKARRGIRDAERSIALKPWLYAITHNSCLDLLRKPTAGVDLMVHAPFLRSSEDEPADRLARREQLRVVVGDLQGLPPRQRDALVGLVFEGRTHEQAAAELGVSVAASKALVSRGRARLTALRDAA